MQKPDKSGKKSRLKYSKLIQRQWLPFQSKTRVFFPYLYNDTFFSNFIKYLRNDLKCFLVVLSPFYIFAIFQAACDSLL